MTLRDIKKQAGLTNRAIALALGCSESKASSILQGQHLHVYHDSDIQRLADILGVTFERCWYAMEESYNEYIGTPGKIQQRCDELRAEVYLEYGLGTYPVRAMTVVDSAVPRSHWIEQ